MVGPSTVSDCLHILNHGGSISDWNATNIALTPKVKHPTSVSDYRPISLCNVSYKIVTKVLANLLKSILDAAISPDQSAFIPNRAITYNSIIAHECIHSIKHLKSGNSSMAALKLDLNKAFDRVELSYL